MIAHNFKIRLFKINTKLKFVKHSNKYSCIDPALKITRNTNTSFNKDINQIAPISRFNPSTSIKICNLFSAIAYSITSDTKEEQKLKCIFVTVSK